MDILAGMLAYVAGIGALFAGLAVAFFVFTATPKEPLQTQSEPPSAHALLAKPSASNRSTDVATLATRSAKQSAKEAAVHSEKRHLAAGTADAAQASESARHHQRRAGASSAQARRQIPEEHDRRWAYQLDSSQDSSQGSSFESRFLGHTD